MLERIDGGLPPGNQSFLIKQARHSQTPLRQPDELVVRSNVAAPSEIQPWERELLLTYVRSLLASVLKEGSADEDDEA